MVKAIFLDFWGTLVENGTWSPIKQVKEILKISLPFSEYVLRMEKAMMTKPFSNLRAAFEEVGKEFRITIATEQMELLVGLWNKNWMLAQLYPEIIETLESLQKEYDLVLISNTDSCGLPQVLTKFNLRPYFKKIFLSYETGLLKTDYGLQQALKELHLHPEEAIMVGDSMESDIIPAKKIGMTAILVDRRKTRDFQPKIESLTQLREVLP